MTLKTEAMVRVLNCCEEVMRRSYSVNRARGNQRNKDHNATFSATFLSQNRRCTPSDGLGFQSGALAAATGCSLLPSRHLDSRFDPDDLTNDSCNDHSGEHLPTFGRSTDAPARGDSAFGSHVTPSSRDEAPPVHERIHRD